MDHSNARRRFLVQSVETAFLLSPAGLLLLNACKSLDRSSDVGELSAGEIRNPTYSEDALKGATSIRMSATDPQNARNIQLYSQAVARMKATEFPLKVNGEKLSWWEAHAEIHNNYCPHGNWFFLPWHRAYLHYFELVCRAFCEDESFSLPYWDWSSDGRLPEEFDRGTEADNPLYNSTRSIKNRKALQVQEISEESVEAILASVDFEGFAGTPSHHPRPKQSSDKRGNRGALEAGPHNKVHATIQGDMGAFISPRDPIFWLHHCNVDRLWEIWKAQVSLNDGNYLPHEIKKSDGTTDEKADKEFPGREYWKNHSLEGFYSIKKVEDKFTAELVSSSDPAKDASSYPTTVKGVLDASALGLVYFSPIASTAKTENVQSNSTSPQTIDPTTTTVPLPQKTSLAPKRIKDVKIKENLFAGYQQKSSGLTNSKLISSTTTIEFTDRNIAQIFQKAVTKEWTAASLRLRINGIPSPSDMQAELQFYLNASSATGKYDNPSFIGSMSFFGHDHDSEGTGVVLSLLPTVKALAVAGMAAFAKGTSNKLVFTAVWDRSSVKEKLDQLVYDLDYLEYV